MLAHAPRQSPSWLIFDVRRKTIRFASNEFFEQALDMTTTKEARTDAWSKIRNLSLPRTGGMIGGVCAAFGEVTVIPAWMWRVGFCTALLFWGTGIVAYLILMLCIPDVPKERA